MILTYKYRIKDRLAAKHLRAHATACNQVWNWCVAQHRDTLARYRAGAPKRRWLSHFDLAATMNGLGKDLDLRQMTVGGVCKEWAKNRSTKFRASFGLKRARGWVPFHKSNRRITSDSVTYAGKTYRLFGAKRRPVPANVKAGFFTEDARGRWYVCFHVEVANDNAATAGQVGIDLGLKAFATLSTGESIESPKSYRAMEVKLATAQRAGNKARARALHAKAANVRRDFHHKLSTRLARSYAFIAVGDVNSKKLAKTRMAKSVLDAGWSNFRKMLAYKVSVCAEVDERFTTQTCSSCGTLPSSRPKGIAGLGIRTWDCSECGASHDRDVNAARNILRIGRSASPHADENRAARVTDDRLVSTFGSAA